GSGRDVPVFRSPAGRRCDCRPHWRRRLDAQSKRESPGDEELIMESRPLVSVVDDDESVRESLPDLLQEFGFVVAAFASAEDFLASGRIGDTRCLILDIARPGM